MIYYEETQGPQLDQRLSVGTLLHHERNAHHELVIFDNPLLGRVLAIDGAIQTTERDEFAYHEMLVHVPLLAHGRAREVLIVGGGDGGALRTALEHPIERATLVEIDRQVVELAREHLPGICGEAFDDPRSELVIVDGARFVGETRNRFDVIIVDSTDPVGPAEALFTREFYANCKRCLRQDGILVTQSGVPFIQQQELRNCAGALRALFEDATFYVAAVPTYNGGLMTLGWATDQPAHREHTLDTLTDRFNACQLTTRYYNPPLHLASFALPNYILSLIAETAATGSGRRSV